MSRLALLYLLAAIASAAPSLTQAIQTLALDPEECYRVHELSLERDEAKTYLTSGYLIFAKPVEGRRIAAVFSAEVESGDAEILLLPPNHGERRTLAAHAGTPNVDEHFTNSVLLFGEDTYRDLMRQIAAEEINRRDASMGVLMAEKWNSAVRSLGESFATRLALELLSDVPKNGYLAELVSAKELGNIAMIFDPRSSEQIMLGQLVMKGDTTRFDTWTSFPSRSFRDQPPGPEVRIEDYRIEATVDGRLHMRCTSSMRVRVTAGAERALPFEISSEMLIRGAAIDGEPAEWIDAESLRANLARETLDRLVVVRPAHALDPAKPHEVTLEHEGDVIAQAGGGIYYATSRGRWYPHRGTQFSTFDLTFHYPKNLNMVAAGRVIREASEGGVKTTERRTDAAIPIAGFNLGAYTCADTKRGDELIEVCSNKRFEEALLARSQQEAKPRSMLRTGPLTESTEEAPVNPEPRLQGIAHDLGNAMDFYRARFGAPPLKVLVVSPIPGTFGQGFAGLIYLSTLAYLKPSEGLLARLDETARLFFEELLQAHELAHQWWGNGVASNGYRDEWIMESLANYSALLWLEHHKGQRAAAQVLEEYRRALLARGGGEAIADAEGPVTEGRRLAGPGSFQTIVYGKGTWIMHMLRRRMGDESFLKMLAELQHRYRGRAITTEQFRRLCGEFAPPGGGDRPFEGFFDEWVTGTGIPALKLESSVKKSGAGWTVSGTVSQTEVPEDFGIEAPVEIQTARGKVVKWVRTASDPVQFSVDVAALPGKVSLDPGNSILRR